MKISSRVADYAVRAVPRGVALRIQQSAGLTRLVRGTLNVVVPNHLEEVEVSAGPMAGTRLLLDLRYEKNFWAGTFEPAVQQTIGDHLRRGGVGWDIGAHVGFHSLLMHRICGPGRVVAVEPDPVLVDRLESNLRMNHALGVHVVAAAAAGRCGTGSLIRHRYALASTVVPGAVPGTTPVRLVTLDALLGCLPAPNLVKLDVPGGDLDVLLGANELLTSVRPVVLIELHGEAGLAALDRLHAARYRTRAIDRPDDVSSDLRAGGCRHVLALPAP